MSLFKKAQKTESKLRLAIAGPSGSGKTFSSLTIATGLAQGESIAVIDTEHGSASKYADLFEFDTAVMTAPYHPDKYVRAIKEAESAGYKVLILDSLTHAWNGDGGLLSIVEDIAARMKTSNSYAAWKDATPIQNRLIEAMLSADMHIIATMRSKQEYSMEKDDRGKTTIRKVGMAPVQRDGMEYEMDIFLDMDMDNNAIVQKTRCPAIAGKVFKKPNGELSKTLLAWLGSGVAATVANEFVSQSTNNPMSPENIRNGDMHADGVLRNHENAVRRGDTKPDAFDIINGVGPDHDEDAQIPAPVAEWLNAENAIVAAHEWAVGCGAQENQHSSQNSLSKIVKKDFNGKHNPGNMAEVLSAFYFRQHEHLAELADTSTVDAEPIAA